MAGRKARRAAGRAARPYVDAPVVDPNAMPVGNLTNWTQTYTQDFTTTAALGAVDTVYSANMSGYSGFTDTSGLGTYDPETVLSVHDSTLDYYIHSDASVHKVAAPVPMGYTGQTYGRYAVRWKADNLPGYKVAFLLWPASDVWNEGEIDWPEQSQIVPGEKPRLASAMRGTYHASLFNMAFDPPTELFAATDSTGWHIDVIEWTPGLVRAIRDDVEVGRTTVPGKVPVTAMRWTLQAETNLSGVTINNATNGHILVDWLVAYSWTGSMAYPTISGDSETWTGTSGAWPSPKWSVNAQGGTVSLSSNTGRMLPAAGAYAQGPCATLESTDPLFDQEVYVELNLTSNAEKYAYVAIRTSGYNGSYYLTDGYMLQIQPAAGNYRLCRGNGGPAPTVLATVSHTYTAGTTQKIRFQINERTINAKVWQGVEPAAWDTTFTDSAVQYMRSGKVQLALTPGAGAAEAITWNNLTVTPTVTALTEDFSGFTVGNEWTEGGILGAWRCQYLGTAGYARIVDAGSGDKAVELKATAVSGTSSTLLTSVNRFGSPTGIKITGRMRTLAQTAGAPNDWESAWLFWHYNDRSGVADDGTGAPNDTIRTCYYLSLKPQAAQGVGGWELGKLDQSLFSGGQRFLASAGSANYPVGTAWRYFEVTSVPAIAPDGSSPGLSITVKAGNSAGALTTLATFVDGPGSLGFENWSVHPTQQVYTSGSVGLYHEDAQVQFDDIVVTAVGGSAPVTHGRQVNASNTGIAGIGVARSSLISTGSTTYSTNGQTITGRLFTGPVTLSGNNITLSGCQIETNGTNTKALTISGTDCVVEDTTILAPSSSMYICLYITGGDRTTIRRVDATLGENICTLEATDVVIEDSYFHTPSNAANPSGHRDVIEIYAGSNARIRRNKLVMEADETAVINIAPWFGAVSVSGCWVEDNYIDGGNMHFVVDLQSTGTITNTKVRRNDMGGHTAPGVIGRYAALNNADSRAITNDDAAQAAATGSIMWPTTGADVNHWVDCSDLSPDRTGQTVSP